MLCPKCYSKIDKQKNRCDYCGFNLNDLNDASNKQAKKALRSVYKDDVLYTSHLPFDIRKKTLLLLTIFLGLFGVHHFYVGKFWRGFFNAVVISLTAILGFILLAYNIVVNENVIYIAFQFMLLAQGINIILWIKDIVDVIFNKYKVPVYKESFSK